MNFIKLKKLTLTNFGPFEGVHEITLPESGLVLVKGLVTETGDGSGAGKSFLLKGISHLFGGCPDPGTELQSWFSEEPPEASAVIELPIGDVNVKRRKGLHISGGNYKETIKGRAAEPELDKLFAMDETCRALVTYRGQRQPGLFLSLNDEKKKTFLGTLLGLEAYEKVAKTAQDKANKLEIEVQNQCNQVSYVESQLNDAQLALTNAELTLSSASTVLAPNKEGYVPVVTKADINNIRANIELTRLSINDTQKDIDNTKAKVANELEAVLNHIRAKTKLLYQQHEPIEVSALKVELAKQQVRLEKVREHDLNAKLEVEKQRNEIKEAIRTLEANISNRKGVEADLKQANSRVEVLQSQRCSECKRPWDGEEFQKSLKMWQDKVEHCLSWLKMVEQAEVDLKEKKVQLQSIKDPAPHPVGKQVIEKMRDINVEITRVTEAFEAKRKEEVSQFEKQESNAKKEFNARLAQQLQGLVERNKQLQNALDCDIANDQRLSGILAQIESKKAVVEERRNQVQALETTWKVAVEKRDRLQKAYWLEKDVVALVGRSGFLGGIVEEILIEIAAIANDILSQVANVRHLSIAFETEREAVTTGNTVAKITPVIYSRGRKVSLSSGVSGGMRTSIELATDLAVGQVISRRRGSFPGFMILDEAFDGLGGAAKESCLEMLKTCANDRLILVVDHDAQFQGLFDQTITVNMVDGRSTLEYNS